jgi:protein-S-isoprenylcysteine O-methyltransferase Ste14
MGVGFAVMPWTWGAFGVHGRGTPMPFDPPRELVVQGPYRYVRNPMYVAGVLVLLGEALLFTSLPLLEYAAAFWLATHLLVLGYEEPRLRRSFGDGYERYRATVNRWVPRRA